MDTITAQSTAFAGLSFYDIFVGDNGAVVLVASMLLALFGNLAKKYRRFINAVNNEADFSPKYWLTENAFSMVAGFFITYTAVRLLNVITPIILNLSIFKEYVPDTSTMQVSEVLIVVSLIIGYYVDRLEPKISLKKLTGNRKQER